MTTRTFKWPPDHTVTSLGELGHTLSPAQWTELVTWWARASFPSVWPYFLVQSDQAMRNGTNKLTTSRKLVTNCRQTSGRSVKAFSPSARFLSSGRPSSIKLISWRSDRVCTMFSVYDNVPSNRNSLYCCLSRTCWLSSTTLTPSSVMWPHSPRAFTVATNSSRRWRRSPNTSLRCRHCRSLFRYCISANYSLALKVLAVL